MICEIQYALIIKYNQHHLFSRFNKIHYSYLFWLIDGTQASNTTKQLQLCIQTFRNAHM